MYKNEFVVWRLDSSVMLLLDPQHFISTLQDLYPNGPLQLVMLLQVSQLTIFSCCLLFVSLEFVIARGEVIKNK